MAFDITIRNSAVKSLRRITKSAQKDIREKVDAMKAETVIEDAIKVVELKDAFRVRVGNYRIIFRYGQSPGTIEIIAIGDRKDIYRGL
ncbi:type II toxin-antitoxin system RelE/ParE family toxin [Agrobacterium sp. OT33]|uniref:type II toxin-antitoxin system RelE family toxin n=1 Tax=Agrobacterium sp. OT33 TaxID=2815338 RepID=UPI001A8EDC02|nr:type II toxin-antitoxin system RelE/ParE family toxin [Agrobacterium sp. OT33]MBO0127126.1 type II toxin-antitoxin system RelE/ParE family toxin [Agrobacterium sp. OT33]